MTPTSWGRTPRESIEEQCARRGRDAVVDGCLALLAGQSADPHLVVALGGPPARWAVTGEAGGPDYWLRVWALRGLLWAWEDRATGPVVAALEDEAWRVRELALKVVARHELGDALAAAAARQDDPVARVRGAAARALVRLTRADA